ncbi:MAG: 1,4-dihydroxy-2-naphthoate octaprenyltransferase [Bergeyella sp.]|nr:1,4-dihydroxy-2-naphthoate octaprenyltransferase [Bergeyella sp.]
MKDWISAARLRTLPLSLSGIVMGSFLARWKLKTVGGVWDVRIFTWAVIVTLLYQILSNYANDYGDGVKGTDHARNAKAEVRAVSSGKISAEAMRKAVFFFSLLSFFASIVLLCTAFTPFSRAFFIFTGLGILCILTAIGYTMGKKPYGYYGLGDLMVFIFFGGVSVIGSYYLFTKSLDLDIILPASAVGFMSVAVLNLNNMRDLHSDRLSGKKTLALRLGYKNAMIYEMVLLQLPLIFILIFLGLENFFQIGKYYPFIVMVLYLPLARVRKNILSTKEPENLDLFLKHVSIITFMMSVLLAFGLNYFD